MITAEVDTLQLDSWLIKKASIMGVALGEVLREEASHLAEVVTRITPPTDGTLSPSQSWALQKRMGRNAIIGDLGRVYVTSAKLAASIRERDEDAARGFSKAIRKRDFTEAHRILYAFNMGWAATSDIGEFDPSHHKRRRNRRGRVGKRGGISQIVTKAPAYNQYKREQLKKVGELKRGWAMAGRGLKRRPKIPAWVMRAEGGGYGTQKDMTRRRVDPYISLVNMSRHASSADRAMRFSHYALQIRESKLRRQVEHMAKRKWR